MNKKIESKASELRANIKELRNQYEAGLITYMGYINSVCECVDFFEKSAYKDTLSPHHITDFERCLAINAIVDDIDNVIATLAIDYSCISRFVL